MGFLASGVALLLILTGSSFAFADGDRSLGESFNDTIANARVVHAGVGQAGRATMGERDLDKIVLEGIPDDATVERAFLYWSISAPAGQQNEGELQFNGTQVDGTKVGRGLGTCWMNNATETYRADVSNLVSGSGSYRVEGLPLATMGGPIPDGTGVSLVVIYTVPDLGESAHVVIHDGAQSLLVENSLLEITFSAHVPEEPTYAFVGLGVGDGQRSGTGITVGTEEFSGHFSGEDGPMWDTSELVLEDLVVGSNSTTLTMNYGGDCLAVAYGFMMVSFPDADGDGESDANDPDDDGDDLEDGEDNCPLTPNPEQADLDSDGVGDVCDVDVDGDGVDNLLDNCPNSGNEDQSDLDEDGAGDVCDPDRDGDAFEDSEDNCPSVANPEQTDQDEDGVGDVCDDDADGDDVDDEEDNCVGIANVEQADLDEDGEGDVCDEDDDGDRVDDEEDNCARVANANQLDLDDDGMGDACDADDDGDDLEDGEDNCPNDVNPDQSDLDADGLGDVCDDDPIANAIFAGGVEDCSTATITTNPVVWLLALIVVARRGRRRRD